MFSLILSVGDKTHSGLECAAMPADVWEVRISRFRVGASGSTVRTFID